MSKFCTSCGAQIEDGAGFCPTCGAQAPVAAAPTPVTPVATEPTPVAPVATAPTYTQPTLNPTPAPTAPSNNSKTTGMIVAGIAVLLAIVILFTLFGAIFGSNYKTPIKNMFAGMEKGNWKKFSTCMTKDQIKSLEEFTDGDDLMDELKENLEDKYGKNVKITVKFKDKDKLDKDDIKKLEKTYKSTYDKSVDIKQAYDVEVEATIKGKDDKDTDTANIKVGKIGSKWYIVDGNPMGDFE